MVRVPGPGLCTPPSACWGPTASHYQGSSGLTGKDFRRPVTLVSTRKHVWMAGLVGLSMKLFLGVPAPQHSGS